MEDGVYNGVNYFNIKYQTKEEKLWCEMLSDHVPCLIKMCLPLLLGLLESVLSQDASNDPLHGGYMEDMKFLETPWAIYTKSLVGKVYKVLEMLTYLYTMMEGMRGVQGFLENFRDLLYIIVPRLVHRIM